MASANENCLTNSSVATSLPMPATQAGSIGETLKVETARTLEEVQSLREDWERLQWNPNADYERFLMIHEVRDEVIRPHVVTVRGPKGIETIVVGRIEKEKLDLKIGYFKLKTFRVRRLTLLHGGAMGRIDPPTSRLVIQSILDELRKGEADLALFNRIPVESDLFKAAVELTPKRQLNRPLIYEKHWRLALPDTYEEYLRGMSKKNRNEIDRRNRRLLEDFPNQISFMRYAAPSEFATITKLVEEIEGHTYRRGLGVGFTNSPEWRNRISSELKRGLFLCHCLYVGDSPVAYALGTMQGRTCFGCGVGYHPDYRNYGVGHLLVHRFIEELCSDPQINYYDKGIGDADYKQRMCTDAWDESSIRIYSPSLHSVFLNLMDGGVRTIHQFLLRHFQQSGHLTRIKSHWRKRLSAQTSPQ